VTNKPKPKKVEAKRRKLAQIFGEFRESAEYFADKGKHLAVERSNWELDPRDENDSTLLKLFTEAGLSARRPAHWRLLLETFADDYYAKTRGAPKYRWTEKEDYLLLREAYRMHLTLLRKKGAKATRAAVCEQLIETQPEVYRVKASYRDPKTLNKPSTLLRRLEEVLKIWENEVELPGMKRNYEYAPRTLADIRLMIAHFKSVD
jgi:hypothetical protein